MTDLSDFERVAGADAGLCVAISTRPDGTAHASVVNAGVLTHPLSGLAAVGLVAAGGSRKLANWRRNAHATLVAKHGWQWCAVEGAVDIFGPDDVHPNVDSQRLRTMLRDIFTAAGGTHTDWDEYDRVVGNERRAAVLVTATRVYSN